MADVGDALDGLAERYWDSVLEARPIMATLHGDHRFDDRVDDLSEEAEGRRAALWRSLRDAVAGIDRQLLDGGQRVTRALLLAQLDDAVAAIDLRLAELRADQMTGVPAGLLISAPQIRASDPESAGALTQRHRQLGTLLDQAAERLEAGLAAGRPPVRINVERAVHQIDKYLASPLEDDPFANLGGPAGWEGEAEWRVDLGDAVRHVIRPAFERYRRVLAERLAPAARSDDRPGLCWIADGADLYAHLVRRHTTLDLDPEEIHRIGLGDLERLAGEYAVVGQRLFGTRDQAAIFERLRGDADLRYGSAQEIMADAGRHLAAARGAMGAWFGRLPVAACELAEVPAHIADDVPVAYYMRPADDGSRPGTYFVNTSHAAERNRFETASVAFHESIPGHHLQLAIAMELEGLPSFQRLASGFTAYVEGWGLYAERLADEMGLYETDVDRVGMLAADSWRACRLVVDTGLHAFRWTRRQAIDFMAEYAPVSLPEIEVEVDRYIGMPGQALAYKIGQREILRLRDGSRRRLGERFDIRSFHDAVLGSSTVTLPVLGDLVEDWASGLAGPQPGTFGS